MLISSGKARQRYVCLLYTSSYMIEARVINGRKYLLIPADDGVEVNGIGVNIAADQPQE